MECYMHTRTRTRARARARAGTAQASAERGDASWPARPSINPSLTLSRSVTFAPSCSLHSVSAPMRAPRAKSDLRPPEHNVHLKSAQPRARCQDRCPPW